MKYFVRKPGIEFCQTVEEPVKGSIGRYLCPFCGTLDARFDNWGKVFVECHCEEWLRRGVGETELFEDDFPVEVVLRTWSNGDQQSIRCGQVRRWNQFSSPRRHEASPIFARAKELLVQVSAGGGVPWQGAPHHTSDFKAEFRGEIPQELWDEILEVGEELESELEDFLRKMEEEQKK